MRIPPIRPLQCTLEMTTRCNLQCRHCYRCAEIPATDELSTPEILEFLDYLDTNNFLELLLEGGEPFCHPDLFTILAHATPRFATSLSTNGTLIDAAVARQLQALSVSAVFVSLYGPTAEAHEYVTMVPGSFAATIEGIRQLVYREIRVVMVSIPMRHNLTLLPDYLSLARELGVKHVSLLGLYRLGRAKDNWDTLAASYSELRDNLRLAASSPDLFVDHRYYPHIHNCCTQACTVDARGKVIGCSYLREVCDYGSIREKPLLEMWGSPAWKAVRHVPIGGKCQSCELYTNGCGGGCRAAALTVTGRWDAADPYCWKGDTGKP